ncbi:snaclec coagulation factor IX/factor X-binding protein subunit A-like [Arapaima gigas]
MCVCEGLHAAPLRDDDDDDAVQPDAVVPVESRRQGTQASRRHLVDPHTGLLIPYISEMNRRIGNFYVPHSTDQFRQGTQNSQAVLVDLKTGLIINPPGEMQRQRMILCVLDELNVEPRAAVPAPKCTGEVIGGRCYVFFSTPQTFSEAESTCGQLSPNGHLASVTSPDLHSRLVFMVTEANNGPVLTWLGGVLQADQLQWSDGSSWAYSSWMPGEPKTDGDKEKCLEMFESGKRWWSATNCGSKRAFICSYSITA